MKDAYGRTKCDKCEKLLEGMNELILRRQHCKRCVMIRDVSEAMKHSLVLRKVSDFCNEAIFFYSYL